MAKIFKPRRGKKSTMAGTKKTTVLSAGEMFIEVPDTGAGTGHSKMKIGDGSTQYSSLPYAMGDTENDKIAFSNDTSGNITTALNKVTSGAALKTMIAALKQAVSLANTSITQLNDETNNINVYVSEDGKLHFVDKDGADTVLNFNSGVKELSFTITGNGDHPNYLDGTSPMYIRFDLGNFYDSGFTHCKLQFTSWYANGGSIQIILNGIHRVYSSAKPNNPRILEDDLKSEDYIQGNVSQQNLCYFTAKVTMT